MGDSFHATSLESTVRAGSPDLEHHLPLNCILYKNSLPLPQENDISGKSLRSPLPAHLSVIPNLNQLTLEGFSSSSSLSHLLSSPDLGPNFITLLETMEEQIHLIRAKNSEMKREIARMYTLVQATNTKIRNNNNLMNGRISNLSDTLDFVANTISNFDSKTDDNNRNILDVEGEVERLRENIGHCTPGIHNSNGPGFGVQ